MEKSSLHRVIATANDVLAHPRLYGGKTYSLALLCQKGFQVPPFVAISSAEVLDIISRESVILHELAKRVCTEIPALRYAVRSSALEEDGQDVSHAGEFLSIVDIPSEKVADAILSVIQDARGKGHATKDRPFSVIIQEFIKGDVAGVVFTRNPLGGREAVCEWRRGGAEGVVGGASVSRIYQNADAHIAKEYFPQQAKLFTTARAIEDFFGVAQDIEWVVKGGELFVLQSRPITTIKKEELTTHRSIDMFTRDKDVYLYSRSGIGESFSSCTPLALDVLRRLYADDGPISRAYGTLGVEVHPTDNFVALHGSLYVDGAKEIKQFFPAYAYHVSANGLVPKVTRWRGLWRTIKNARKLSRINAPHPRLMQERLIRHVLDVEGVARAALVDTQKILDVFFRVYQDIFLINLYAEDVFRDAEKSLHRTPFSFVALLSLVFEPQKERSSIVSPDIAKLMKGNSLNIGDEGEFVAHHAHGEVESSVALWWGNLSGGERRRFEKIIRRAQEYQRAREKGRHLAVLLVSLLRNALREESGFGGGLIYYATIDELITKNISSAELVKRKTEWEKDMRMNMPSVIATMPLATKHLAVGVSLGVASGAVITDMGGDCAGNILLVERLTPDLAPYLAQISGIIAMEGGVLSHMAILAREAGVPVVIDPNAREKVKMGMRVRIDGASGVVEML